jgi:hypothetical protein
MNDVLDREFVGSSRFWRSQAIHNSRFCMLEGRQTQNCLGMAAVMRLLQAPTVPALPREITVAASVRQNLERRFRGVCDGRALHESAFRPFLFTSLAG